MTTNFYVPPELISGERVTLPDDEARHASKVLRAAAGDDITVVDGVGGWYRVRLDHVDRRTAVGHVVERRREVGEPSYHVTIAMGVVKNRARFETFLEKAAELGVAAVVPLVTDRTEREAIRLDRSESKLIAAMKQCGRSRLVQLSEPTGLDEFLSSSEHELGFCFHESAPAERHIARILNASNRKPRIAVMVGPEGGFSDAEVERARSRGWEIASLGPRRLRAETAAIAAAAAVSFAFEAP